MLKLLFYDALMVAICLIIAVVINYIYDFHIKREIKYFDHAVYIVMTLIGITASLTFHQSLEYDVQYEYRNVHTPIEGEYALIPMENSKGENFLLYAYQPEGKDFITFKILKNDSGKCIKNWTGECSINAVTTDGKEVNLTTTGSSVEMRTENGALLSILDLDYSTEWERVSILSSLGKVPNALRGDLGVDLEDITIGADYIQDKTLKLEVSEEELQQAAK